MHKLYLTLAAAAASLVAGGANAQPYGYTGGYLPAPAYAYAGYGGGYAPAYSAGCGGDSVTLLGAHAGVTVLGIDASVGGRLGIGSPEGCRPASYAPQYAPPPPPQQQYAPPQAYAPQPQYAPAYSPPPRYYPQQPDCGCMPAPRPRGW